MIVNIVVMPFSHSFIDLIYYKIMLRNYIVKNADRAKLVFSTIMKRIILMDNKET